MTESTREVVLEIKSDGDHIGLIADAYDYETGDMYQTAATEFADTGHKPDPDGNPFVKETFRVEVPEGDTDALEIHFTQKFSGARYAVKLLANDSEIYQVEYPLEALGIKMA